jgi:uncharacterized membrane protein
MTSPQPVVPLLNYGTAQPPPRDRWILLFFLLSLTGWPVLFLNYTFQTSPWEIASKWAATALAILLVLALALRNYRRRLNPNNQALICLYLSFLPNAVLCILSFWGEGEIGYYLAAAVTAVYVIHVVRLSFMRWV